MPQGGHGPATRGRTSGDLRLSCIVGLQPEEAFATALARLRRALGRRGIAFDDRPGGRLTQGSVGVGEVTAWRAGELVRLEWRAAPWIPEAVTTLEIRARAADGGTRLSIEHRGWGRVLDGADDVLDWFVRELAAPFVEATAPDALGEWITDRGARRPWGAASRAIYRDPLYHYPGFRALLAELSLGSSDRLLEVGCGGGALLSRALESGCRAAAVDHSPEMSRVAAAANREALDEGRLGLAQARADALPFADGVFTCAAMAGVLGFLARPVAALVEIRRVLSAGGRAVIQGMDPELRGTPAAPEPMASRLTFYEHDELAELGLRAGFDRVRVIRHPVEAYAREVGVPQEHLALFAGPGQTFLIAEKNG